MERAYDNAKLSILRTKALNDARKAANVDENGDDIKEEVGAKIARELAEADKEAADKKKYDKDSKKKDGVLVKKSIKKAEADQKAKIDQAKEKAVEKITEAAKNKISKGSSLSQKPEQEGDFMESYHIRF